MFIYYRMFKKNIYLLFILKSSHNTPDIQIILIQPQIHHSESNSPEEYPALQAMIGELERAIVRYCAFKQPNNSSTPQGNRQQS
jgi:hypothetical protein